MAELPHIGKQCSVCNQLDFLPITCFYCSGVFCKDHAAAVKHKCTADIELKKDEIQRSKPSADDYCKCVFCSTSVSILESITCLQCRKRFCLQHRHKVDHNCQSLTQSDDADAVQLAQERRATVESLLKRLGSSSGVTLKNRGKKNDALAQRVAAMKLKSTASGQESLPQEERIYFYLTFLPNQLSYDQEHKAFTDKPIFLCKEWTVGKCIDWIATHFTLINRNNEPKQSKLVLTSEQLLQTAQEDCPEESAQCCDKRNGHLCFSHELKDLESRKVIGNTDKLLISYFKL